MHTQPVDSYLRKVYYRSESASIRVFGPSKKWYEFKSGADTKPVTDVRDIAAFDARHDLSRRNDDGSYTERGTQKTPPKSYTTVGGNRGNLPFKIQPPTAEELAAAAVRKQADIDARHAKAAAASSEALREHGMGTDASRRQKELGRLASKGVFVDELPDEKVARELAEAHATIAKLKARLEMEKKIEELEAEQAEPSVFTCEFCGKEYDKERGMRTHVKLHCLSNPNSKKSKAAAEAEVVEEQPVAGV